MILDFIGTVIGLGLLIWLVFNLVYMLTIPSELDEDDWDA